ncbi:MAG: hypothetical protein JO165_00050 [Candidatus Eremiobacteraeota bacterium]|nr:hypothetical protein [Candidatus Eremiobacteraeota bacterium]
MIVRSIALVLAAVAATPSPSPGPSASPQKLTIKTIATVRSTPYCGNLGEHFNRIVQPMLANDVVLDRTGVTLDNVTNNLRSPDFAIRFAQSRADLAKYVDSLMKSLPVMQDQINQLRSGEKLTTDPDQSKEMHLLAQELQRAYNKQMQLTSDLHGVLQGMMDFDTSHYDPTSTQNLFESLSMPKDMKNVKSYLRFDGQRDVLADAENKAGDIALDIAEKYCGAK